MKKLILGFILLSSSAAFAEHECKEFAMTKAAKFVDVIACDQMVKDCKISLDKITIEDYYAGESAPTIDFYSFIVPVSGIVDGEKVNDFAPVRVVTGLAGIGSSDCVIHDIFYIDEEN